MEAREQLDSSREWDNGNSISNSLLCILPRLELNDQIWLLFDSCPGVYCIITNELVVLVQSLAQRFLSTSGYKLSLQRQKVHAQYWQPWRLFLYLRVQTYESDLGPLPCWYPQSLVRLRTSVCKAINLTASMKITCKTPLLFQQNIDSTWNLVNSIWKQLNQLVKKRKVSLSCF